MATFYTLKKAWNGHAPDTTKTLEFQSADDAAPLIAAGILEAAPDATAEIISQVRKAMSTDLAEFVKKGMEGIESRLVSVDRSRLNISGGVAAADKTKSFGDFLVCAVHRDEKRLREVYMDSTKAALAEITGSGGGYLVPPEYMNTLLRISAEKGVVRPRARIIPMGSRSVLIPGLKQSGAAVSGQFQALGGMVAYWTEEAQTRTETEPVFRQIELIAHELAGYSVASRTLMADSAQALDAFLTGLFADTIAMHEDYSFLQGDGVGKPLGVLASTFAAAVKVNRSTSNTFKLVDAAKMWGTLLPSCQEQAVWVMNQSLIPQLMQMVDTAGRVIFLPVMTGPSDGGTVQQRMVPMLFGRPIIFTEKLPYLGTTGDVLLCDFSYYLLGDRQQIEVAASEHVNFLKNQMTWRFLHRVDGQPWLDGPYKYQDGTTVVTPFVVLN